MRSMLLPTVISLAAHGALAQDSAPPLAGPEVVDDRPAQLEQGLTVTPGMAPSVGQQMGSMRQLPPDDVAELLRRLGSDEVEPELRLTDEQRAALKLARETHQADVREHQKAHAETFRELRDQAGYNVKPRVPDDEVESSVMDARLALRALYASGPTAADLQVKMFALLTEPQQAWTNAEIERITNERRREQARQQNRELLEREPVDPETFFNADGTVNLDALPQRLRERFEKVEEPQRSAQLRRLVDRLSRMQGGKRQGAERPTDKRAPAIETIEVPQAGG